MKNNNLKIPTNFWHSDFNSELNLDTFLLWWFWISLIGLIALDVQSIISFIFFLFPQMRHDNNCRSLLELSADKKNKNNNINRFFHPMFFFLLRFVFHVKFVFHIKFFHLRFFPPQIGPYTAFTNPPMSFARSQIPEQFVRKFQLLLSETFSFISGQT